MDEALKENGDNSHPYIICIGTISAFTSAVAVCNNKVITGEIGQFVFSAMITLLAIHYTFELTYNPSTQQVLEFLQEKLIGDRLPAKKKTSTAYSNIFRAVNCIELSLDEEQYDPANDDDTQEMFDF